jgi:C_GCAxxG_C_C family probable redox protein
MTMQRADAAATTMLEGYNCAQAVLSACGPGLGLDRETCLRLAAALGGGLARSGNACGAVTGALLAIGLARAGASPTPEAKELAYGPAGVFLERWRAAHGSLHCRDLAGCDVSTPEGLAAFRATNVHDTTCTDLVRDAVRLVDEVLG